jgi:hypothetical protein
MLARVFDLGDTAAAAAALLGMANVANFAGAFAATSAPMITACLMSRTHYLDITGEIDVFVAAQSVATRSLPRVGRVPHPSRMFTEAPQYRTIGNGRRHEEP